MSDEDVSHLKSSEDDEFFEVLEKCVEFKIPVAIKNVLKFNYYSNAVTLSKFDQNSIKEMEEVMRHEFNMNMVPIGSDTKDYLCRYINNQEEFKFIGGQIRIINSLADYCRGIFKEQSKSQGTQNSENDLGRYLNAVLSNTIFFFFKTITNMLKFI